MLTNLQERKLTRLFHLLDNDSSGFVDGADLDRIACNLAAAIGAAPGSRPCATLQARYGGIWRMLLDADANLDGRVTLREWLRASEGMLRSQGVYDEVIGQLVDKVFDLLDANHVGSITAQEYASWLAASNVTPDAAGEAFQRIDLDSDGALSKDEIRQLFFDFYYSDDPQAPGNWLFGGPV